MKKIFLLPLVLLLAAVLVLGSCGETTPTTTSTPPATQPPTTSTPTSTQPPVVSTSQPTTTTTAPPAGPTGTLRVAYPSWIETMDPNLQTTFEYVLYEHLITINEEGNYVPELAESWSLSDDGLVWTFKLRKGIKFHNGDDLTSADVKFSFERIMREGSMSPWAPEYSKIISSIEAPDDYTAEIHCNSVNYMFYTSIWGCPIVPKNYIEANGDEYFNEHPIGSAPWKFVALNPGVNAEFEAVTNHWRLTPEWAKLDLELVPEPSTRLAKLKRGEVDIVDVDLDQAVQVRDQGFELRTMGRPFSPVIAMLGTWTTEGPISDIRVRKALSLAINRQEVADTFFNGLAIPGGVVWTAPVSWGYDPSWVEGEWFEYDPDEAKALLAEAGYPDSFANPEITILSHATNSWLPDLNLILSGYWEAVGVKTKIVNIDGGQLRGQMYGGGDESIWGAAATWNMPTMQVSIPFLASALVSTGNWQLLHDPEFDALWASITQEPDPEQQIVLFRETVTYFLDKYVVPGVVNIPTYYAVSPDVGEWTIRNSYDIGGALQGIKKK